MKINKVFKYKFVPNKAQIELLDNHFFSFNQAWNITLSYHLKNRNNDSLIRETNPNHKSSYLSGLSGTILDQEIKRILTNRNIHFNTKIIQQARLLCSTAIQSNYKSHKTKKLKDSSIQYGDVSYRSSSDCNQILETTKEQYSILEVSKVPNSKYGILRLFRQDFKYIKHREIPKEYNITNVKIQKNKNKYYVLFNVNYEIPDLDASKDKKIGLDFNIKSLDLGNEYIHKKFDLDDLKSIAKLDSNLKLLQRKQSRRIVKGDKGNKNYKKTQDKIVSIHEKIKNKRTYFLHVLTNSILTDVKSSGCNHLVLENLNIKNMTSKTNKIDYLGTKGSKTMRKNILALSPGLMYGILIWKSVQFGIHISSVNPAFTSRTCSKCGTIKQDLTLKDRTFNCSECDNNIDRDLNACLNIIARA